MAVTTSASPSATANVTSSCHHSHQPYMRSRGSVGETSKIRMLLLPVLHDRSWIALPGEDQPVKHAFRCGLLLLLLGTLARAADFPQPYNSEKNTSIPLMAPAD